LPCWLLVQRRVSWIPIRCAPILSLWDEAGWSELTPAEQELWQILGWDEASWEGEAAQPASEDKYWFGLSEEERAAAGKLGYTKESWDE